MRRRVFLSGAVLTGVGLPLLAGCKLPWRSKRQTGSPPERTEAEAPAKTEQDSGQKEKPEKELRQE